MRIVKVVLLVGESCSRRSSASFKTLADLTGPKRFCRHYCVLLASESIVGCYYSGV
jgi:hypothetical protein